MDYQISNNFITACVKDLGAELFSLKRSGVDIEYIWQGDEKYWARHAPVLFPIVGKLLDDEYTYKDKTYKMSQHGFARDSKFELFEARKNYLCFKLESNEETLKKYPFNFELFINYKLTENVLKVTYKVINLSDDNMPFSIGAHPAFNWPLSDERKNESYFQFDEIDEIELYPLTKNGISSQKEKIEVFDDKLCLSKKIFKNDALIIEDLKNKNVVYGNSSNDKFVRVEFDEFKYLGLWSKPEGAPFVCIEPWNGIADFIDHNKNIEEKIGIRFLEKNEVFESSFTIEI